MKRFASYKYTSTNGWEISSTLTKNKGGDYTKTYISGVALNPYMWVAAYPNKTYGTMRFSPLYRSYNDVKRHEPDAHFVHRFDVEEPEHFDLSDKVQAEIKSMRGKEMYEFNNSSGKKYYPKLLPELNRVDDRSLILIYWLENASEYNRRWFVALNSDFGSYSNCPRMAGDIFEEIAGKKWSDDMRMWIVNRYPEMSEPILTSLTNLVYSPDHVIIRLYHGFVIHITIMW